MKEQFEIFTHHPQLVYLDNAATVQKPKYVLDEVSYFLTHEYANIHRGTYPLALAAEEQRDRARNVVAEAIGAKNEEVIFTGNATQSSNLVAQAFVQDWWIKQWDIIAVGIFDHHANIAPRQLVAQRTWATLIYVWFDASTWQYDWSVFETIDLKHLKVVSLSAVSNVTGQILDLSFVKELSKRCKMYFVVDASQAVPHLRIDVNAWAADFVFFTGHKLGALTGIGVLWGKKEHLNRLSPVFVGWWSIDRVDLQSHTYQPAPDKFEAGTPNVMWAVSLRAAFERIAWLAPSSAAPFSEQLATWYDVLAAQEEALIAYCGDQFAQLEDQWLVQLVGSSSPQHRIGLFSRSLPTARVHNLWRHLGDQDICIRTGAHCTHPLHAALSLDATARMSLWIYNERADLEKFFSALRSWLEKNEKSYSS